VLLPHAQPFDDGMASERAADSLIEQARLQGGRRVEGAHRQGRAGQRIIEEGLDRRAAAIATDTGVLGRAIG
jgi:hypothetical protein